MSGLRNAITAVALLSAATSLAADTDDAFLAGEVLRATFVGATLIGGNWAEYYGHDGVIVGKIRYMGFLRDFTGRWIAKHDQVCFEYGRTEANTCSMFRRRGDRLFHFAPDGKPKSDHESKRLEGNRLDEFK
ncbi:MAG: hypothetical protein ACKVQT_14675 [Burkholderiales bacterium]